MKGYQYVLLVLLAAAVVAYSAMVGSRRTATVDDQAVTVDDGTAEPTVTESQPSYTTYSPSVLETTTGTRLLFFTAPWSPECQLLDESIKAGPIPDGVTIIAVDYDSNPELRQQYGVVMQSTVVKIDADGNKVDSFVAYKDPTLSRVLTELQ